MRFETLAVHATEVDPTTGGVSPPIHLSTTYARDESLALIGEVQYAREGGPTHAQAERALARLDGAEATFVFASGMAAATAVLQAMAPGDRILVPDDAYYGVPVSLRDFLGPWGLDGETVDMGDLDALAKALSRKTRLVWLETPSNPLLKVTDLAAAIGLAHEAGAIVLVDNTFASPALQRPIALGADLVMQSSTKYLGGHSDVMGGVLSVARRDALYERIAHVRHILGAIPSPFASWLVLRGVRTLPLRMERHSKNAAALAAWLTSRRGVGAVHYPGLPDHPRHEAAAHQMSAFGGMLSFHVAAGREAAIRAVARARLFVRATSLGSVESLIEHRQTSEGAGSKAAPDLVRVSAGLEHVDDLIEDLDRALA